MLFRPCGFIWLLSAVHRFDDGEEVYTFAQDAFGNELSITTFGVKKPPQIPK